MQGNRKLAPSPVRIPQELKDWLKHRAIDNRRSFNSEVIQRLEESRVQQLREPQPQLLSNSSLNSDRRIQDGQ